LGNSSKCINNFAGDSVFFLCTSVSNSASLNTLNIKIESTLKFFYIKIGRNQSFIKNPESSHHQKLINRI